MRALAIVLLIASPAVARAQAPGETPESSPATASAPPALDAIDVAGHQPLGERAFFTGTALTAPSGTVEVSGRILDDHNEGYLVDIAIGLARGTELWLETGVTPSAIGPTPFSQDQGTYDTQAIGLEQVIARGSHWQLAAEASLRRSHPTLYFAPTTTMTLSNGAEPQAAPGADYVVAGTLYGTVCFDLRCRVAMTAAATLVDDLSSSTGTVSVFSASANVGGDHLRGLAEVLATPDQPSGTIRSMLLLGARYGWTHLAIEGGFAFGTDDDDTGTSLLLGMSARL
ncbi:MAG TPA: hypothetical protein VGL61_29160 [Kofleriaceae bacterium]|jgi:hypothetical protein